MSKRQQLRERIEVALIAEPGVSDRSLACQVGCCTSTVGSRRANLLAAGVIPHVQRRLGVDGRLLRNGKTCKHKQLVGMAAVYFIEAEGLNLVKIGRTNDLAKRFLTLASSNAAPLKLLAYIPDDGTGEEAMHARFSACRHHGEWFTATEELRAFIAGLPPGDCV